MATIKFRRDSAANWTLRNPVLASGEPGYELDTNSIKIGDGFTKWTGLPYFAGDFEFPPDGQVGIHISDETPHPVYDDGPSLALLYENAKV